MIDQEISYYFKWVEQLALIGNTDRMSDLAEAIEQMRVRHVKRIFQLLSFLYDSRSIHAVYANWQDGNARQQANAIEVIDQLLKGKLRTDMTKIISSSSTPGEEAPSELHVKEAIQWFYDQNDPWINLNIDYLTQSDDKLEQDSLMKQIHLLKRVALFAGLTGRDFFNIAMRLQKVWIRKGVEIVREGDPGDSLYLIEQGHTGIYIHGHKINELSAYDYFGEISVITQRVRSATVIAEEDVVLYELTSSAFYEMIFDRTEIAMELMKQLSLRLRNTNEKVSRAVLDAAIEEAAVEAHALASIEAEDRNETIIRRILVLQKISLFAHCSQEDFIKLARMVEESVYEPGERICGIGEDGDTMYGIIEGKVQVHKGSEQLATLEVGQCFGEMAIIDGQPRSADCTSISRTILLELTREQVFSFCFQKIHVLKGLMRVLVERTQDTERLV